MTATEASEPIAIGADVGGTFTDVALLVGDRLVTAKVPTTEDQSVGVVEGIEKACEEAEVEPAAIDRFSHAMTVSVNALLERDGAKTALVTTEGFADVLEIGRQDRPSLYDLDAEKPEPIVPSERRFEVTERATPDGIETAIDPDEIRTVASELDEQGVESVAVCFLHAYASTENETDTAAVLRDHLDVPVSVSHEVLAEFREFERTSTTAVDAYVTPAIDNYVGSLVDRTEALGLPEPAIMQANGGTADAETVRSHAVTTVLSGPAAGVVGATAAAAGDALVTFDMGGTSTDVSFAQDGRVNRTTDGEIAGLPIGTPMVDIETVGAGGGSIAWVDDGGALRVGPRSAGADPGPACYGRGGTEPTVTDANVVLGYIGPDTALGGELTLDVSAAWDALSEVADRAGLKDARAAARGVYRVANATMTRAIRSITVERGHDPRTAGLVAFGGAGPMHAVAIADSLDMPTVTVPRPAGVLSAFGLLAADESHDAAQTVRTELARADREQIEETYDRLESRVLADTAAPDRAQIERAVDCRYVGQSFELSVPIEAFEPAAVADQFTSQYAAAYGYTLDENIEAVTLRVTATVPGETPDPTHVAQSGPAVRETRSAYFPAYGEREATVYDRARLAAGDTIDGPAILESTDSTTVLPPESEGTVTESGSVEIVVDQ